MAKKKSKKHIITPLVLLVYLASMAWYFYPGANHPELSLKQYYITIGVTLGLIIALVFFLRKKEEYRQKYKDPEK
jgi:hypothetical protein